MRTNTMPGEAELSALSMRAFEAHVAMGLCARSETVDIVVRFKEAFRMLYERAASCEIDVGSLDVEPFIVPEIRNHVGRTVVGAVNGFLEKSERRACRLTEPTQGWYKYSLQELGWVEPMPAVAGALILSDVERSVAERLGTTINAQNITDEVGAPKLILRSARPAEVFSALVQRVVAGEKIWPYDGVSALKFPSLNEADGDSRSDLYFVPQNCNSIGLVERQTSAISGLSESSIHVPQVLAHKD